MLRNLPTVTKNLLYINVIMFLASWLLGDLLFQLHATEQARELYNSDIGSRIGPLNITFGLFYFDSPYFMPHQLVTHMFMHGGIFHIFINMFMLAMFGSLLERVWGAQRFFIFYFVTGFGAVFLHQAVQAFEVQQILGSVGFGPYGLEDLERQCQNMSGDCQQLFRNYITPTVGASGAVYGLLIAFGYLFPNTELMFLLFPMPIKAKYLVPLLVGFELFLGITSMKGGSNIAHFAHLGGALFGFILLKYWESERKR